MRPVVLCLLAFAAFPCVDRAQVPVFEVIKADSSIKFSISASVSIAGTFDKWDVTAKFTSPDLATAVLDIKIQADSVNTGSGMKDSLLKGKDFLDVKQNPLITFHSTKVVQTGPDTVEVDGDFTIRRVTKQQKLTFAVSGLGTGSGTIKGALAFDRKDFGMNSGFPFIKVADRIEVTVDLKAKRISGPPVVFKKIVAPQNSNRDNANKSRCVLPPVCISTFGIAKLTFSRSAPTFPTFPFACCP